MVESVTGPLKPPRKRKASLRTLLLQVRDEPAVRQEELDSFARFTGLAPRQIDVLNAFDTPDFGPEVLPGYDALFVGGGSEASVLEPDRFPFIRPSVRLLLACMERGLPTFASCFGFQLAVVALGGRLIRDRDDFEMGSLPIQLTPEARSDPLFADTPNPFYGISVHKERTLEAPPGTQPLAFTANCCHAFRVRQKPFWAFQFHPEVDRDVLVQRLTVYRDRYTEGADHLNRVLASARETPEANALPARFVGLLTHD